MVDKVFDFAIVGAGVTGSWIALQLSRYEASICLLEKDNDVCMGATKANSAIIHAGYDARTGTHMASLNVRGNEIIRKHYKEMSIPFRQIGSLVLAFTDEDLETIRELYKRGINNGVKAEDMELLSAQKTLEAEPNLNSEVKGSLYAKTAGVVNAFELCTAAAEVAVINGTELITNFEVFKIDDGEVITGIKSSILTSKNGDKITAKYIINAAGVHADEIANLMGDYSFKIIPRRGEYCILDKNKRALVSHIIFQPPVKYGKGILVSPTVDENILVGPTADNIEEKEDKSTTREGLALAFTGARLSVPSVSERDIITSFSGIRPIGDGKDFILGFSEANDHLINAAGIESPGLTAAPAVGEFIVECIKEKGIPLNEKSDFNIKREVIRFEHLSDTEKDELIKKNPLYGRVICRCETVTEEEIIDSIRRPAGARDLDGVKRRTRAGLGRCQGGFCSPKVIEILARELNKDKSEITKFGGSSWIIE